MIPTEFAPAVERCDAALSAARAAMARYQLDPTAPNDAVARDAALLCEDVLAVVGAAQWMLRRPFVDRRGAVLRRIVEAAMIATSEAAAAIELWGAPTAQWLVLGHECERCRDAMRHLLTLEVHGNVAEMSGAT
jgi:hypothetical protein